MDRMTIDELKVLDRMQERPAHWWSDIELPSELRRSLTTLTERRLVECNQGLGSRRTSRFYRITAEGETNRELAHVEMKRERDERVAAQNAADFVWSKVHKLATPVEIAGEKG